MSAFDTREKGWLRYHRNVIDILNFEDLLEGHFIELRKRKEYLTRSSSWLFLTVMLRSAWILIRANLIHKFIKYTESLHLRSPFDSTPWTFNILFHYISALSLNLFVGSLVFSARTQIRKISLGTVIKYLISPSSGRSYWSCFGFVHRLVRLSGKDQCLLFSLNLL